jgi:hypothetical protein
MDSPQQSLASLASRLPYAGESLGEVIDGGAGA